MERITLNGVEKLEDKESERIIALRDSHDKSVHYLAFAKQLYGYSPLGTWLRSNEELTKKSGEIIDALKEKKEVCSLYPKENLTLYPIITDNSASGYHIDLSNNEKNFADILEINDNIYKSEYLVVDFDHLEFIKKDDFETVITSLQDLLKKSNKLKNVYITDCVYHVI